MKLPSTIIAVFVALLCIAAMWRFGGADLGGLRTADTGPRRLLNATQLPVDKIDRITLKRGSDEPLVFERVGGDWRQIAPFEFPVESFSIRQMAQAARELEVADQMGPDALGSDQTPATLQLSPPAAEISYQWPGGSLSLELGRRSVAGRAYLRIKNDPLVYVVNQKLHERAIDMNPWEWRDRRLFHAAGIESDRIEIQADGRLVIERDGGGRRWSMLEPSKTRVDAEHLDAFLQALGRAEAAGFVLDVKDDKELANFGLNKPVASITVTSRAPALSGAAATQPAAASAPVVERLLIGSRTGSSSDDRFGMIEGKPVVLRLNQPVLMALLRRPVDLAAPTGSGINPADVKSITIRAVDATAAPAGGGIEEMRLERDLDKWRAPDKGNAEVNANAVQELLDQLCKLRAPNVEFREYPRELELAVITLHGFDGKALDTVRIAQEKDKPATALENGDNVLRVFPQGLKMRLRAADYGL